MMNSNEDEQIPEYTEVLLTDYKIKQINIQKYSNKRVVKLSISSLLDTEIVKKHETMDKFFYYQGDIFKSIKIRGVVVGLKFLSPAMKHDLLVSVDDGTGTMDCFMEKNVALENLRTDIESRIDGIKELLKEQRDCATIKAAMMMTQSSKKMLKNSPPYSELEIGDTVDLIGNFSEYNGKRICFIVCLARTDC